MLSELYLNKLSCFKIMNFITAFSGILVFADTCPQLLSIPFKASKYGLMEGIFLLAPSTWLYFAQFSNSPIRYDTDYLE